MVCICFDICSLFYVKSSCSFCFVLPLYLTLANTKPNFSLCHY